MPENTTQVTGGVDTHQDNHVAAVVDEAGRILGSNSFPATPAGYRDLLTWMTSYGQVIKVGVEGTGSYGSGLCRHLTGEGVEVVEVNRPNRQMRRLRGKSDTVDAEAAARAALNGEASAAPKDRDGIVESIRVLRVAYTSMRDTRRRVSNQMHSLIVSAPAALREQLGSLGADERAAICARFRTGDLTDSAQGTKAALRSLGRHYTQLTKDLGELHEQLEELIVNANPALVGAKGVGVDVASILLAVAGDNPDRLRSEAAFAALCGVSPIEASSGKVTRHRLNRGGNRSANNALWRIVMVRLTCDAATKEYMKRRTAEGKSRREVIRCLKRYVVREMYRLIVNPPAVITGTELREARTAVGITMQVVADELGTWVNRISELERGVNHNTALANRYKLWLESASAA